MRPARVLLISVLLACAAPVATATTACASEGTAALVVDTGEAEYVYCVVLPDGSVSGLDLIVLAGEQHGLSYRFGFNGQAVCMLAGVGPTGEDCFEQYPDFWGYWRGDGDGGWSWSGSGAGSTVVEPGDVEGWSWGSGGDGDTHPRPPATTYEAACGSPEPAGSGSDGRSGRSGGSGRTSTGAGDGHEEAGSSGSDPAASERDGSGAPGSPAAGSPGDRTRDRAARPERRAGSRDRRDERTAGTRPTAGDHEAGDGSGDEPGPADQVVERADGPPAAGLAGLGATVLLLGAGAAVARRRRTA